MPFLGPAFIACVAYVDPGNFATNVAAGAEYGYALGWVVLTANLFAMLRRLDQPSFSGIAVMPIPEHGLGLAINDRLRRAAADDGTGRRR